MIKTNAKIPKAGSGEAFVLPIYELERASYCPAGTNTPTIRVTHVPSGISAERGGVSSFDAKERGAIADVTEQVREALEAERREAEAVARAEAAGSAPPTKTMIDFNWASLGNKYRRKLVGALDYIGEDGKAVPHVHAYIDVYSVLATFETNDAAVDHATKKLLCAGLRNKGSRLQDLTEARQAIDRAIQNEEAALDEDIRRVETLLANRNERTDNV